MSHPLAALENGKNEITFDGTYSGEKDADIKIEIRASGMEEIVKK